MLVIALRTRRRLLWSAVMVPLFFFLFSSGSASANHANTYVDPAHAPLWARNIIKDRCENRNWNIVQLQWVSPRDRPSASTTTVEYGAASVALDFNRISYRCHDSGHSSGSSKVTGTNPSITALNGLISDMPYPAAANTYQQSVLKQFNYPGPFNTTKDITLTIASKGTVTYSNGDSYCAVVNTEPRVSTTGPHNFDPQPGYCYPSSNPFTIRVRVNPPPAPTCTISASPTTISHTQTSTLSWSSTNATSASLNQNIGGVSVSGSRDVTPSNTTTYILTVSGAGGTTTCRTTVTVRFPNISCQNITPSVIEAGQPAAIAVSFRNDGNGSLLNARVEVTISGGLFGPEYVPFSNDNGASFASPNSVNAGGTGLARITLNNPQPSGVYTVSLRITGGNTPSGEYRCDIGTQLQIVNKPYLQAFSADVRACGSSGTIRAHNKGLDISPLTDLYAGSGVQFAAFSNGQIDGYASALLRAVQASETTYLARRLSFANNSSSNVYGGDFDSPDCIENYWRGVTAPTAGPVTNAGEVINPGTRTTRYIDGNLIITGNITYNPAGWNTANTPYVRYVVRGDIYISPGVGQLDGDYIAVKRVDNSGGTIYTCANGGVPSNTYVRDNCNTRLFVYGSFIAPNIRFLRMSGSLHNAQNNHTRTTSQAAEVFIQSPENWFTNPEGTTTTVDSITSLPPLL